MKIDFVTFGMFAVIGECCGRGTDVAHQSVLMHAQDDTAADIYRERIASRRLGGADKRVESDNFWQRDLALSSSSYQVQEDDAAKEQQRSPEVITLGNMRPEGTTKGPGGTIYVSHMCCGGIDAVDVETGAVEEVIPDRELNSRGGFGLDYYEGVLFQGGGGPKGAFPLAEVYVYDVDTGNEIVACQPLLPGDLMNEVAIRGEKAYITDIGQAKLMVMDIDAALNGECQISSIDLPEVFNVPQDELGANGVAPYGDGLIIVHMTNGSAYYVDLLADNIVTQVVDDGAFVDADGLVILDDKMYVTQNFGFNQISVWKLSGGRTGMAPIAVKEGELTSPLYDSTATSVIYRGYIYSVNSRSATLSYPQPGEGDPEFDEDFHMVAVRNVFGLDVCIV